MRHFLLKLTRLHQPSQSYKNFKSLIVLELVIIAFSTIESFIFFINLYLKKSKMVSTNKFL